MIKRIINRFFTNRTSAAATKTPPSIELPTPADQLWSDTYTPLREAIARLPAEDRSWAIGGGTVLAARWDHRRSTDIDVTLNERTNPGALLDDDVFWSEIEHLKPKQPDWHPPGRLIIPFRDATLDLCAMNPRPAKGHETTSVDGQEATVLSDTQILYGKLSRAWDSPVRDLFDIIIAEKKAPAALAAAVNMFEHNLIPPITQNWREKSRHFETEARAKLSDVTPHGTADAGQIARAAADVVEGARYAHVRIRTTREGAQIDTRTVAGHQTTFKTTRSELDDTLEKTGLREYLLANDPHKGYRALTRVAKALRTRTEETVYETSEPTATRGPAAKIPLRPSTASPPTPTSSARDGYTR